MEKVVRTHTPTPSGFEAFVAAQTPQLLSLGIALTGNSHDAWDLVQEALVRLGERWQRSSWESPEAYVRTIMVRLNVDRFRRLRRERPVSDFFDSAREERDPDLALWLLGELDSLPRRQRSALVLRFVEDMSVSEIAARMNCSQGTVKSQLSRGLTRLRERLPREVSEEGVKS